MVPQDESSAFAIASPFLLALKNTLAFYVTGLITAVISCRIQAPILTSLENLNWLRNVMVLA
jgi:hypothetical protein